MALAIAFERGSPLHWTPAAIGSLGYLVVFGTALTLVGLFWLVPRVSVAVIGTIPLLDMLIAVLLGALVLGEALPIRTLAGGALILAGVFLATRAPAASPDRQRIPSPDSPRQERRALFRPGAVSGVVRPCARAPSCRGRSPS